MMKFKTKARFTMNLKTGSLRVSSTLFIKLFHKLSRLIFLTTQILTPLYSQQNLEEFITHLLYLPVERRVSQVQGFLITLQGVHCLDMLKNQKFSCQKCKTMKEMRMKFGLKKTKFGRIILLKRSKILSRLFGPTTEKDQLKQERKTPLLLRNIK